MPSLTDLKSAVREGPPCGAERPVVSRGSHVALSDATEGQAARQGWEELNSGEEFISIKGWPERQGTGNAWNRKQKKLDWWKLAKSLFSKKRGEEGAEQDGRGVGDLDFVWSQEFSWIGIKPF